MKAAPFSLLSLRFVVLQETPEFSVPSLWLRHFFHSVGVVAVLAGVKQAKKL